VLQVFNVAKKEKLKDITFTENIVHWTWFKESKLAVVTPTSVYHIDITNPNE